MPQKKICVIGAGASGLAAIKSCKEEGLEVTCFEKDSDIGGVWRYRESDSDGKPSVMRSTIMNTSKENSAYSDFPPPEDFCNFMHNTVVLEYLQMYAKHFDLRKHILFLHEVVKVEKSEDYEDTGRWVVTVRYLADDAMRSETFDGVMVCAGHHIYPSSPKFKGLEGFRGKIIHTHSLKTSAGFENLRVLIIGIGNSGVDAAVELSHEAKKVYLSTRRGSWILPRVFFKGLPADVICSRRILELALNWNIFRICDRVLEFYLNSLYDHDKFQLKPQHHFFSAHPTINDALPNAILSGKVIIKQDVDMFENEGVVFQDEDNLTEIDAVVLATGYHIKFPFLGEDILSFKDNKHNLYKLMFPPDLRHPSLVFIGLIQPWGAIFPISEAQSRWFAFLMKTNSNLPSKEEMVDEIESRITKMDKFYVSSPRHTIQRFFIKYMDEICSQFGTKPNLLWLAFSDPRLFLACWFKPCVPYQYRLNGPHSWSGARESILTMYDRIQAPLNTCRNRKVKNN